MKPINVRGNSYRSISEAWRAESPAGLQEITVRRRLAMGWHTDDAFTTPAIPGPLRRMGGPHKEL